MRRIFAFLVASVDGYYEGPNGEFDWPVVDDEFNQFGLEQLSEVGTLIFGRTTYEGMASYWPTPAAEQDNPQITAAMNGLDKIVASTTLEEATWANTRLIKDDVAGELAKLKLQPGKDMVIMGSSNLTVSLLRAGLVDELRIMVMPVVLGDGHSLFRTADDRISLKLVGVKPFKSGNVWLTYKPETR
jgi:dihydrofolate reductase